MLKYQHTKKFFSKDYTPNWSEDVFELKNIKIRFHERMSLMYINDIGTFYEKKSAKKNQEKFRIGKVINRKGNET